MRDEKVGHQSVPRMSHRPGGFGQREVFPRVSVHPDTLGRSTIHDASARAIALRDLHRRAKLLVLRSVDVAPGRCDLHRLANPLAGYNPAPSPPRQDRATTTLPAAIPD